MHFLKYERTEDRKMKPEYSKVRTVERYFDAIVEINCKDWHVEYEDLPLKSVKTWFSFGLEPKELQHHTIF